jgi:hypothetical protein
VKGILKRGGFGMFMAAMLWCVTGCSNWWAKGDDETFNELREHEIIVEEVYVEEPYTKLYPYGLVISISRLQITRYDPIFGADQNNNQGPYAFYSDEKCTVRLQEDTLVTVNGKPPCALYRTMSYLGDEFEVYLDFLPQEDDKAVFSPEWFFAKSYAPPYNRHKIRIITESMPIKNRIDKVE